jgi:chromosome segregation ATPase
MSEANEFEMTREDEIAHLKKRRAELKTISCNLQGIFDWFEKHENYLESSVAYHDLEQAITEIDDVIYDIDGELEDMAEEDEG